MYYFNIFRKLRTQRGRPVAAPGQAWGATGAAGGRPWPAWRATRGGRWPPLAGQIFEKLQICENYFLEILDFQRFEIQNIFVVLPF